MQCSLAIEATIGSRLPSLELRIVFTWHLSCSEAEYDLSELGRLNLVCKFIACHNGNLQGVIKAQTLIPRIGARKEKVGHWDFWTRKKKGSKPWILPLGASFSWTTVCHAKFRVCPTPGIYNRSSRSNQWERYRHPISKTTKWCCSSCLSTLIHQDGDSALSWLICWLGNNLSCTKDLDQYYGMTVLQGSALKLVVFCMAMGSSHVAEVSRMRDGFTMACNGLSVAITTCICLCVFDMSIRECRGWANKGLDSHYQGCGFKFQSWHDGFKHIIL